jgi:hypothetical protein
LRGDRRREDDFGVDRFLRDEQQNRLQERHVAAVGSLDVHRSVGPAVTNRGRVERRADRHRRLQQ